MFKSFFHSLPIIAALAASPAASQSNLFAGVKPAPPSTNTLFYITNSRGWPVMTLTSFYRSRSGMAPMTPSVTIDGQDIALRLPDSTTQNAPMSIRLGESLQCEDQVCWEVNFATDGGNPDYVLSYLDRDVPMPAGQYAKGCYSDPDTQILSKGRAVWATQSSATQQNFPRIVLRPNPNTPGTYQLRAIAKAPEADGSFKLLPHYLTNTGTPKRFDDSYVAVTSYVCTWRILDQQNLDNVQANLKTWPNSQQYKDELATYQEEMAFQLYASNGKFCDSYAQYDSNAGQCDTCTVGFEAAGNGKYRVTANNGWSGLVEPKIGQSFATRTGNGEWSQDVGGAYAGVPFDLTFEHGNNQMIMHMKSKLGTVIGKYHCAK